MAKDTESEKLTDLDNITVSADVLAKICSITERRVRQIAEEGIFVRAAKGRYKLMESLKSYIVTLKVSADGKNMENVDGELNLDEERAMHERVKRHMSELKLQTMKGELHKAEMVKDVMVDMLSRFRTKILALPAKISPKLEDKKTPYIKELLMQEMTECLNELKDYNANDFYDGDYLDVDEDEENE